MVRPSRLERAPDPLSELGADRDVHEVRVRRGQPAGSGARLAERRMDASAHRIDELGQRVDVRRLELGQLAMLEDQSDDGMLLTQSFQRVRVSRVTGLRALADRQPQVLEENLRELLRRVQVELLPRDIFDFLLDRRELRTKLVLHLLEVGHVDGDALTLHIGEHAGERQLDLVEEIVDSKIAHLSLESRTQVENRFRAPRRKFSGLVLRDRRWLARRATCAQELLGAHQLHAEELARQVFEPRIPRTGAEQIGGEKRAECPVTLATAE